MEILEQENTSYNNETFNEKVVIRGCHNVVFNDCKFQNVVIHVDRDSSNLEFHRTIAYKIQVGYFRDEGILDGLLIDTAISQQFQIFYASTVLDPLIRRTRHLVWRNLEAYNSPLAPIQPTIADNPIIENSVVVGAHGERCNSFQINNCINPVIRGNTAGDTVSTTVGDGVGIIVDQWHPDEGLDCQDALIEDNLCFGSRIGISNWGGRRSVIRNNRLVDNEIGLKFNKYSDYHAYKNSLLNNETDVKFTNGATDAGYA